MTAEPKRAMGPAPELREEFKYTYEVEGVQYRGSNYSWDVRETSPSQAPETLGLKLERGKTCTVHYDPKHPATSVLVPRVLGDSWGLEVAALVMAIGALCLWHPRVQDALILILGHGREAHEAFTSPATWLLGTVVKKAGEKALETKQRERHQ